MKKFTIIKTTYSNAKDAKTLANKLLSERLCACVQISKIESHYPWQQKIHNSNEFSVEIKTKQNLVKNITKMIKNDHEYETPQIISFDFHADGDYQLWLDNNII